VEEVADGVDDFVADAQDRLLALAADPEVPAIEQVVDAVLLRRDREVVRLADDAQRLDVDLVSARRALVGARGARGDDRGFLGQVVGRLEQLVADRRLRHDGLDEARAVAQDQEMDLAARAAVVEPPLDGDLFALVPPDVFYVDVSHRSIVSRAFFSRASDSFEGPCAPTSNMSGPSDPIFFTPLNAPAQSLVPSTCL